MNGKLRGLGLLDAHEAYVRGSTDPVALLSETLARIAADNPEINALITPMFDQAHEMASAAAVRFAERCPRSLLDGVIVGLKDNIDVAGVRTTNGTALETIAAHDAAVSARLRQLGAVLVGKLNMHEGALGATTDNPHWGRTQHPRKPGYTPGGSSGGTSAAVAAGFCALGLGTDTLGSVRIPAAYCGLVGFKPSRGRISTRGVTPLSPTLDHVGPIGRCVADVAVMFHALDCGERNDEPAARKAPHGLASSDLATPPRLVRAKALDDVPLEPAIARALASALGQIARAFAPIQTVALGELVPSRARRAGLLIAEREVAQTQAQALAQSPEAFSAQFRAMVAYGRDASAERVSAARDLMDDLTRAVREVFAHADVLISATAPQAAFAFDEPTPSNQADLTALANLTGCPAISLPLRLTDSSLDVGLHLMAREGADVALLNFAHTVETHFATHPLSASD